MVISTTEQALHLLMSKYNAYYTHPDLEQIERGTVILSATIEQAQEFVDLSNQLGCDARLQEGTPLPNKFLITVNKVIMSQVYRNLEFAKKVLYTASQPQPVSEPNSVPPVAGAAARTSLGQQYLEGLQSIELALARAIKFTPGENYSGTFFFLSATDAKAFLTPLHAIGFEVTIAIGEKSVASVETSRYILYTLQSERGREGFVSQYLPRVPDDQYGTVGTVPDAILTAMVSCTNQERKDDESTLYSFESQATASSFTTLLSRLSIHKPVIQMPRSQFAVALTKFDCQTISHFKEKKAEPFFPPTEVKVSLAFTIEGERDNLRARVSDVIEDSAALASRGLAALWSVISPGANDAQEEGASPMPGRKDKAE